MTTPDIQDSKQAKRLGLALWEYHVTFPTHFFDDEKYWCGRFPEFAAEISGFSEAARRSPFEDWPDERLDAAAEAAIRATPAVDRDAPRPRRLGLALWEFLVGCEDVSGEEEERWCRSHPEFAAEISGLAEAARRFPIDYGDLTPQDYAGIERSMRIFYAQHYPDAVAVLDDLFGATEELGGSKG